MQVQWGASPRPPATGRICGVRPLPASGCQGPPQGKEGMRWSPGHLHQELIKRQYSWPLVSTSSRYCLGGGGHQGRPAAKGSRLAHPLQQPHPGWVAGACCRSAKPHLPESCSWSRRSPLAWCKGPTDLASSLRWPPSIGVTRKH